MTVAGPAPVDGATGLQRLSRELWRLGLAGFAVLLAGSLLFGVFADWQAAFHWLVLAGPLWMVACRLTHNRLSLNRQAPAAPLFTDLGLANRVTLLRGWLIAVAGGFFLLDTGRAISLWLPAVAYMAAAVIDRVDGFIARRSGQVSLLGAELDTVFDAMGLAVAPLVAWWFGKVHWSYLAVGLAWFLYQWGQARRHRLGLPVHPLAPNFLRRTLAGFQMGFLAVALWPVIDPAFSITAGWAFMLPMLVGFGIDWLVASGRIRPADPGTALFFERLERVGDTVVKPLLRLLLVAGLAWSFRHAQVSVVALFGGTWFGYLQAVGVMLGVCLVFLGLMGRLGCLILIVLLGAHFPGSPDTPAAVLFIVSCVWVMVLGTGRFSLWQWDDVWVRRHDGA